MNQSFVSSPNVEKPEPAVSRWSKATACAAKVGKGLSKDEKAIKLAPHYWLEVIDPRHRYGQNLNKYHDAWSNSQSSQPFFYWLDVGDGKEVDLKECPRMDLKSQVIQYLTPEEGEAYEVIVQSGKLVYRQNGAFVDTSEGIKWMFVLSTSRRLYVGQKKRGMFQHSSFVAGAAMIAAGRIVAHNGLLKAIWSYSGHYRPTEEHFMEIIQFLEEHHVDLNDVKKVPIDDGVPPVEINSNDSTSRNPLAANAPPQGSHLVAEQNVDVVASDLFNDLDKKCLIEQSALVKNTEEPARKYESQSLNLEHSRNQSTLQISSN